MKRHLWILFALLFCPATVALGEDKPRLNRVAVAMMAAGWDDGPEGDAPGFPDDGTWIVRHEGLMKAQ